MSAVHAKSLRQTYAQIAQGYEKRHTEVQPEEDEQIREFIQQVKKNGKVLDLGAGNGTESKYFAEQGFVVTMFDLSPEMLAIARKKVSSAQALQGDMTAMDFEQESFDGVWARASLLHLTKAEAQKVVQDIYTILKKDGIFFATVKKGSGEKEITDDKYGQSATRFFAFYSESEVRDLFEKSGFEDVQIGGFTTPSGQEWIQVRGEKR